VAERVRVREISNEEGNRLLRIVRRSSGSVVTWRRAQMVLLSAQAMDVSQIARVTFTSPDRSVTCCTTSTWLGSTRCIHAMAAVGRQPSPSPSGARSSRSPSADLRDHDLPFSTWSWAGCWSRRPGLPGSGG
jgi:hypothetical protein